MVPMHDRKAEKAFHKPLEAPPGFGVRQSSGALAMQASQPKAPEDWRSPRRCRAIRRFMVPMHSQMRKRAFHEPYDAFLANEQVTHPVFMASTHVRILEVFAFHEPQGRAGCPQPAEPRRGEDTAPFQMAWFMVPLHDLKAEKALES